MKANQTKNLRLFAVISIWIVFWGCAGKPFDPPQTGEIPKGPGIFSKSDDGAVLYESKKTKNAGTPGEKAAPAAEKSAAKDEVPTQTADYEEFEAYQQFKAWKESAQGSEEYEAFQQWREWRKYQQWKQKK